MDDPKPPEETGPAKAARQKLIAAGRDYLLITGRNRVLVSEEIEPGFTMVMILRQTHD